MIYRNNTCTCISQEGSEKFIHVLNKKLLMKSKIVKFMILERSNYNISKKKKKKSLRNLRENAYFKNRTFFFI